MLKSFGGGGRTSNSINGSYFNLPPQATTGADLTDGGAYWELGSSPFPGNLQNDFVIAYGYNYGIVPNVRNRATDPMSNGFTLENNYEHTIVTSAATAGTTTTTLNDSGKTYAVNQFIGWTLYNSTRGISQTITSNTATSITTAAITGQVSGDSYQVLRRDVENYFQIAGDDGTNAQSFRWLAAIFDRGTMIAQLAPLTITGATNANPVEFTTSTNHGMTSGGNGSNTGFVAFEGVTGGTWAANLIPSVGTQFGVTVTAANKFTLPINSTGFGTLTAATARIQPPLIQSVIYAAQNNGLEINMPAYQTDAGSGGRIAWFRQGVYEFFGNPSGDTVLRIRSYNTFQNPRIDFYQGQSPIKGILAAADVGNGGQLVWTSFDGGGANGRDVIAADRTAIAIGNATSNPTIKFLGTGATGFFNSAGTTKQTITGSKAANAALTSLMTALAAYGLVTDSTT